MLLLVVYMALAHWLALAVCASTFVQTAYRYVAVKAVAGLLGSRGLAGPVQHAHDVVASLEPSVRGVV